MTGLLQETMRERADSLDAPALDVAMIVAAGEARQRRRRTAIIGAAVSAAVVATLAGPSFLPGERDIAEDPPVAAGSTGLDAVYAIGSTLHVGGRSLDAGHEVVAMVRSTRGVVFTDAEGGVWAVDGTDRPLQVGRTHPRYPTLKADGSLVAWMERDDQGTPVYAVLDQATGSGVVRSSLEARAGMGWLRDEKDPALVVAVDRTDVYVRDSRGLVAWNPTTDAQRVLGEVGGFTVDDVKAGLIAHRVGDESEGTYRVGPALGAGRRMTLSSGRALSPDGRFLIGESEPDEATVLDTTTGRSTEVPAEGYVFFAGYGWADADTYVGLALTGSEGDTPVDILACDIGGSCRPLAEAIGTPGDLVLPFGISMDQ